MFVTIDIFSIFLIIVLIVIGYFIIARLFPILLKIIIAPIMYLFFIIKEFLHLSPRNEAFTINAQYKNIKHDVDNIMLDFNDDVKTHPDFNVAINKRKELKKLIYVADEESKDELHSCLLRVESSIEKYLGHKL